MHKYRDIIALIALIALSAAGMRGQCWIYQSSYTRQALNGVSFAGPLVGTAVGDNGTIFRTTDGGSTWTSQESGSIMQLLGVVFTDGSTGTAVGWSGTILRTTDGGVHWLSQTSGTSVPLYGVCFTNAQNGTAVGGSGNILSTSDGGSTWSLRSSLTTDFLNAVAFSGQDSGFAVGSSGTILRTTDRGWSWTVQSSGVSATLCGVWCLDGMRATAVGRFGTILQTTDGGSHWRQVQSGVTNLLRAVTFQHSGLGIAAGAGVLLETTDAGVSWDILQSPQVYLNALSMDVAVGSDGTTIRRYQDCAVHAAVTLSSPSDRSVDQIFAVNLEWSYSPKVQVSTFILQVGLDSGFAQPPVLDSSLVQDNSSGTMRVLIRNLKATTTYFWRVGGKTTDGTPLEWSAAWRFKTSRGSIVTGVVFDDINRDSTRNPGEPGLQDWCVTLTGKVSATGCTNADGIYSIAGLDSGVYVFTVENRLDWSCTLPESCSRTVTVGIDDSVGGIDFGNTFPWNTVSGTAFQDLNENGRQDTGEVGFQHWLVRIHSAIVPDDSTRTDAQGHYIFRRVDIGESSVSVSADPPWEQITPPLLEGYRVQFFSRNQHLTDANFSFHRIPPRVKLQITLFDSRGFAYRQLYFGVRPGATYGIWGADSLSTTIDFAEWEFELPPLLPGLFDGRFIDPHLTIARFGYGSWTDMRGFTSPAQVDTYLVTFSPGRAYGGDYPMRITWSPNLVAQSYTGPVFFQDMYDSVTDMKAQGSLQVVNPLITSLLIIARGPVIPPPQAALDQRTLPNGYALDQNYPNPFNQTTIIRYRLPEECLVVLKIYDVLGREVQTLVEGRQPAGVHSVFWDSGKNSSGLYFYRLSAGKSFLQTGKMLLMR